jgi:hypothetical protein
MVTSNEFDCREMVFEHCVQPLDNLVSLSVFYRCSVSAIKRANPGLVFNQHHIPAKIGKLRIPVGAKNNSSVSRNQAKTNVQERKEQQIISESEKQNYFQTLPKRISHHRAGKKSIELTTILK